MRRWQILAGLLCMLLAGNGYADDQFLSYYQDGLTSYRSGSYLASIISFERALGIRQMPRLYYNLGMANLRLKNAEQAIFYLRKYLAAEPDAPPDVQEKTQEALTQALALRTSAMPAPGIPPAVRSPEPLLLRDEPEPAPAPLLTTTAPLAVPLPDAPPSAPSKRPLQRPVWRVLSGIGGLALGMSLVGLGVSALSTHGRCADAPMPFQPCLADYHTMEMGIALSVVGFSLVHLGSFAIAVPANRKNYAE